MLTPLNSFSFQVTSQYFNRCFDRLLGAFTTFFELLSHFMRLVSFYSPENIRKSLVFLMSSGVYKKTSDKKWHEKILALSFFPCIEVRQDGISASEQRLSKLKIIEINKAANKSTTPKKVINGKEHAWKMLRYYWIL